MKKKLTLVLVTFFGAVAMQAQTALTVNEMRSLYSTANGSVVSIHDPSVVFHNGSFHIWGTHLGTASSKDLVTYTGMRADNTTFAKPDGTRCDFNTAFNEQVVKQVKNYKGNVVDFPQVDGEAWCSTYASDKQTWISGNMWAPDIIYNEQMKKWCMYLSLNGDHWASVIILLTAPTVTGPFTYQGPVVMGGFNGASGAPSYKGSDMEIALGSLSSLPGRYNQQGGWGTFWPNCIDPCVFYDEEGNLWMSYGSWSGGIFLLRLDKETGLRDYTYTYTSDYDSKGANFTSDAYFGKRIAGGYYVSGEGSYIQHIGQYYYLFVTYGGLSSNEGYDMRVFRSKNPDGPYVDASGVSATYTGYQMNYGPNARTNRGLKLMSAYNLWGNQNVGQRAQGHNSACQDDNGRSFVVFHTRFNDGNEGHQVRAHQLFLNEKDWIVAAPFAYRGETTTDADIASTAVTDNEIVGTYHFLIHPYLQDCTNAAEETPVEVSLTADGKVTGDYTGTWSVKEGTSYLTLKLGGTTYYGVFMTQHVNGATTANYKTTTLEALAFSAVASSGVPVWGYKLKPQYAVAYNYLSNTINVKAGTTYSSNISLMFPTTDNTTLTWTSSVPEVIDETGKYAPADTITPVTLTGRLECGDYYWEQSYDIRAQKATTPTGDYLGGIVAYYDMDSTPCYNAYDESERTYFGTTGTKPVLMADYDRFGKVVHQSFGVQGSNSSTRMPNPLLNQSDIEGFTVSMWVKRTDGNMWDAIWSFFNSTSSVASGARLYLTGNAFLGYDDNAGTDFSLNYPGETTYTDIPVGSWALVTVTVGTTNGVRIYVNGANKTPHSVKSSSGTTRVKELPISELIAKVTSLKYFFLGLGSPWGSADCYIDDILIYNRELSAGDVRALNIMSNRVTDFSQGGTGIEDIETPKAIGQTAGIYDLQGRRVTKPVRGLYIIDGKKVFIK